MNNIEHVYVVTVMDEDGYFIPKIVATTDEIASLKYEEFCNEEKDNDHWDLDCFSIDAVRFYE